MDETGGDEISAVGGVEAVHIGGVLEVVGVQGAVLQGGVGQYIVVIDHDLQVNALLGQGGLDDLQQLAVRCGAGADDQLDRLGGGDLLRRGGSLSGRGFGSGRGGGGCSRCGGGGAAGGEAQDDDEREYKGENLFHFCFLLSK